MSVGENTSGFPLVERQQRDILFRSPHGPVTAARFLRDVQRLAAELPPCRYVFNLCRDRHHFTVAFAAAVLRGQVSLLSSHRSPEQLRRLAEPFGDACSVGDDSGFAGPLRHHLVALSPEEAGTQESPVIPADRLAAIVFTSGSTGEPVGHRKTWGALAERSRDAGLRFAMTATAPPAIVGTVPSPHMYGFETTVLLPLHAAASSWSGPAFYPADVRQALRTVPAPRLLVTTPLQIRALLEAEVDLPPLAAVISATAPLDTALAAAAEQRWNMSVLEIFGATEVGSIASRRTTAGDAWTIYDQVRLLPAEADDRVLVEAPFAAPQLLGDAVAMLDAKRFRLLGRADDMIKLGGRRASLAGLNHVLTRIEGVEDGVFIAPEDLDRRPTARLLAYVIAPRRSADDILGELRNQIDPVFLPRRVIQVDALPRNEVGKLPADTLRRLAAQYDTARPED